MTGDADPAPVAEQADDELWPAITDPSRRLVLDLIAGHADVSASWLAGQVPFSRQAVAKHLVVLERAGLVSRRRQGREVLYRVEASRLDQAVRAMAEVAARWDRRLAALRQLAETAHAAGRKGDRDDGPASTPAANNSAGDQPAKPAPGR